MASRSHGQSRTPLYAVWRAMRARCENIKDASYHRYGARGVKVCVRWRESFSAFLRDMGERPSPDHTLERIDNGGHYEPRNCRWATRIEQARNTRRTVFIHFEGERRSASEWAELLGLKAATVKARLRYGYSVREALTEPKRWSTK